MSAARIATRPSPRNAPARTPGPRRVAPLTRAAPSKGPPALYRKSPRLPFSRATRDGVRLSFPSRVRLL